MKRKIILLLDGMTCGNCERRIESALKGIKGVEEVKASFSQSKVEIVYDGNILDKEVFISAIERLGYGVLEKQKSPFKSVIPLLILLFAGFYIIQNTIGFQFIPEVSEGMGYGLIFLVGVLTSIHCIAMCGGIAFSQSISVNAKGSRWMSSLLYNTGRVLSYTAIGGIVGGLGAVITPSGQFKGIVAVGAGIFMFLLGLKMLNILRFPNWVGVKMPGISHDKIGASLPLRPFFIGLFNGFMPCGPLQTMQLYALGTGSVTKGALSMFFFSIGTVPILFLFGAITSAIGGKFGKGMMKASAVLVMVLGIMMFNRGLALSGMALDFGILKNTANKVPEIRMEDGKQVVNMTVGANDYVLDNPIVQVGVPVKIKLDVQNVNGCNNPLIIPAYGIEIDLRMEDPVIEFTPAQEGPIRISCWMGMITAKLTAVEDPSKVDGKAFEKGGVGRLFEGRSFFGRECCSTVQGENKAVLANVNGSIQTIEMNVGNNGYSPNILVVQKGLATRWVINGEEINGCTYMLTIPDAGFVKELKEGRNEIRFTPEKEGEIVFTCSMNMLRGKIVIVEDLRKVDVKALEASSISIPGGGGSCH
ncbi:urease accessory protein UreH domain-containing protein [Thermotalea metallivorans]|uniref:HMA domain-containing protein n=1 Tax=Thermotalea metallivorans TaxID=520762 RepID=A0A140L6F3_9FIRM|nr:sulfite exporter TauE/SafE family protein [Thermotalea metallivorans]KXG76128.1 hypothetical protein AN619_10850 [Thermotalea metallivorans]